MENFMELDMKKKVRSQSCDIWGRGPKNYLRAIWALMTYQAIKSRTLTPILTNRTSFTPEAKDESNKIMKS